jgi:hypothetical protein
MQTPDLSHRSLSLRQAGQRPFPAVCERKGPAGERRRKSPFPRRIALFPHIGTCLPVGLLRQDPVVRLKRVCPSDCCGKIPWSGSRWNSRNVRSICIRTGSSRQLRKVRAFSSGCFGMIPLSGSRWNSRSARSTCRSTFAFPRPRRERVCPSDCCGKIPRSGPIRNSKNARSTCNKTSYRLLLPGQGSLGSEVHPERICVPPCENHSTMTSGCAKPPRPKLRGLVVLGDAESESS